MNEQEDSYPTPEERVQRIHDLALAEHQAYAPVRDYVAASHKPWRELNQDTTLRALHEVHDAAERALADAWEEYDIADKDYVFAYGDNSVLLVGCGEDGVYVVEREVLDLRAKETP